MEWPRTRVHTLITFHFLFSWSASRCSEHAFSCSRLTFQWLDLCPAEGHTKETSLDHPTTLWVLGEAFFVDAFFFISEMHMYITLVIHTLLYTHVNTCTKQISRSFHTLVHPHVTGKRAAFAWGWSVGYWGMLVYLDRHFYDLPSECPLLPAKSF